MNTGGTNTGGNGPRFTVDAHLASDEKAKAPGTIGIVTWSVDLETVDQARIEFGLDTEYGMAAPVDLAEAGFRTLLLGMKPDHTYHFRVVVDSGGSLYTSDDHTIDTGPPTTLLKLGGFTVRDDAARERGFIVTSYWSGGAAGSGSGTGIAFIVDADGDIVWWHQASSNSIARARMSADGKNMWMVISGLQGGPLERVSMDTLEGQTYPAAVGSHDITPIEGDRMAYLEYGESDCDSIFEIDPSGRTAEVFESQNYLSGSGGMGCHSNAIRYSRKEDVYTFSDLTQDVFIINRSGGVEWRLSEIVRGGNSAWGGTQHGHHLLDDGIVIFANSAGAGKASAVIEYALDGSERTRYESAYGATNLGDVQRLPGGNTLITYSTDSIIQEIDSEENVVLEISGGGTRIGYALWRDTLYGAPSDLDL